ncbi:agmatine deiminase family protein [Auritidibacter ignavus]|uniref:agmatine deiminase family protein n=1 Tax=Auritidibacter ignavus TaxID=678932 RepID=UPI00244941A0|nr:agmatine deiminase family protein [Auritidibacter ignavus]WGH87391.1 agmatine deiminase family protein [Auritidibacter ignavus]WGH89677.1 agmatine deiminase family protein [Auritidibacter ignavus]
MQSAQRTSAWELVPESDPVERVWMAFPPLNSLNATTSWQLSSSRRLWSRVAETIHRTVPVAMLVDPADGETVDTYLLHEIPRLHVPLNNALLGRTGPSFVVSDPPTPRRSGRPGRKRVTMIDWTFNGFGRAPGVEYRLDDIAPGTMAEKLGRSGKNFPRQLSLMVAEGGSWVSDGAGTAIASEQLLTDQRRNPGWNHDTVERELHRLAGINKVMWIPQGLTRGSGRGRTGGHIDHLVNFIEPGTVVLHQQNDPSHPDHRISAETEALLSQQTDASGRRLSIIPISAPQTHSDALGPVNWSYLDFRVLNELLLVPRFIDPADHEAFEILGELFPERALTPIMAQELFDRRASLRAITLPQPRPGIAQTVR